MKQSADPDVTVVGVSWLYNLDAYRRLFPPAYGDSAVAVPGGLRSMALWGQLVDHRGALKAAPARALLEALARQTSPGHLPACFPFRPLTVHAPARKFYEFYRVGG